MQIKIWQMLGAKYWGIQPMIKWFGGRLIGFFRILPTSLLASSFLAASATGGWQPLKIGGGGFVTRVDIAPDGTQIARADTAMPWVRNSYTQKWRPVTAGDGFPDAAIGAYYGACEIAIASSSTQRLYMWLTLNQGKTYVYSSNNRGENWSRTDSSFPTGESCASNGAGRLWGPKMAVGPQNENVVYLNSNIGGIYYTLDGGSRWSVLTSINPSTPVAPETKSSTSHNLATGFGINFVIGGGQCNVTLFVTAQIQIWQTTNPSNQMTGKITSCSGTTLTVTITNTWGTGSSITDWSLSAGPFNGNNLPNATGGQIVFDPSDATGNTFYATSQGHGVWKCVSATTTPSCSALTTSGAPKTFIQMTVDGAGTVWIIDNSTGSDSGNLYRYLRGKWSKQVVPGGAGVAGVTYNPTRSGGCAQSNCVYTVEPGGCLIYSINAQVALPTWIKTGALNCSGKGNYTITSAMIPWIQTSQDAFFSANSLAFDPTQNNALYLGMGIGLLKTAPPHDGSHPRITWSADETEGIENLDLVSGQSIVGGGLMITAQDRPIWFASIVSYPASYGPTAALGTVTAGATYGCANQYGTAALGIAGITGTTNGGASWSRWKGGPPYYGNCAYLSSASIIWLASQNSGPHYSTTGAAGAFHPCTFSDGVTAGGGGFLVNQNIFPKTMLAQDGSTPNTVLLYNDGTGATNGTRAKGFWISTSGCSFTHVHSSTALLGADAGARLILSGVPNRPCHFFGSAIQDPHDSMPGASALYKSTDCGTTWSPVSYVKSFLAWGFGAAKPDGDGYPVFYCACWASTNGGRTYHYSIWASENIDQPSPTWIDIDTSDRGFPYGNFDQIVFVQGDLASYGTVYVGFAGSGGAYRVLNFLLMRDLDPAANDNSPMWLKKAG